MRLDFNVLWVDDQRDSVIEDREKLERLVRKEGFRLRTELAANIADATNYLSESVYRDHVDLILMDYHLEGGPNGDVGLVEIRRQLPFRDMVFYSAAANELQKKVEAAHVEGVYCSTRNDLAETAYGVFQSLVKKVVDIDHARGIVLGATSDLDYLVNECLTASFEAASGEERDKALEYIKSRMIEIRERFAKGATKVETVTHVSELSDLHYIYTSVDRANLLRTMLDNSQKEAHAGLKRFIFEIAPRRNDFAHVRVQVDGFSRKLFDRSGKEVTVDEMRNLRVELLGLLECFEDLKATLESHA